MGGWKRRRRRRRKRKRVVVAVVVVARGSNRVVKNPREGGWCKGKGRAEARRRGAGRTGVVSGLRPPSGERLLANYL